MRAANDSPRARPRYELVVAAGLFLLAAIYFGYAGLSSYVRQVAASRSFSPVPAIVVSAEVRSYGGGRQGGGFTPHIVYRYAMNGKHYEAHRYFFTGAGWRDHSAARAVLDRYAVGATVEAYFDPRNPNVSVLDRSIPSARVLLVPAILVCVGAIVLYIGVRGRHPRER